ncbi:GNAT family N-acetyltransferase [Methanosarcina horonobensis]|uniref:GNAT family N-acetyltransferase n=1 Tax=Methanosarcina horonobensis TaxID=418008 RepID=UPI0022B8BFDC|nr:GNAT family N-acetyltransferase [Methanosarcina horonobensis]
MSREEAEFAIEMAAAEGWNPGVHDGELFYEADPEGFFIAELEGKPAGCASAVVYDNDFGFLGLYVVKPEFQKKRHRNETDRKMPGTPGRQKHRA